MRSESPIRPQSRIAATLVMGTLMWLSCKGTDARLGVPPGAGPEAPPTTEVDPSLETASITLALTNVPTDALCLELSVSPAVGTAGARTQLFDTVAGTSPNITMPGLPSGNANVFARSFGVPCAQVQTNTIPTWVSAGPLPVTLVAGQTTSASIVLRKPSNIQISASFDDGSLSITPSTKDFGGAQIGGTASADFSVLNPGTAAVTLPAPTFTGTDGSQFQVYQNGCTAPLAAGASCTIKVAFKPTSTGAKTATLNVGTGTASLSGTAVIGALAITPTPVNFASTQVGSSTSMTVTLANSAAVALSFGGWSITGAGEFAVGTSTCTATLAPSSTCTTIVTFTPISGGSKTATLSTTAGASVTLNGSAPVSTVATRINCGSSTAVSPFAADQYASGGTQHSVTNTINLSGVSNPAPQAVYQSERYGNVTYTIPGLTASAQYAVRLHFAELYWSAASKRIFTVAINGTNVLTNFDVYATAGAAYKAVARDFTATANASGQVVIKFTNVTDNATISGIEVTGSSCAPTCAGRCGGSDGCGGTCPNTCVSPLVCGSNGQCSCPAGTCGSSCLTCSASTPICSSAGQCVQCSTVADCASGYMTCTNGTCGCRATDASNKLVNPNFDAGSYAPWVNNGATFSASSDADNCPASGSMNFTNASPSASFSQCVAMAAGSAFRFGFRYKGPATCVLSYHSAAGCSSSSQISWEDGFRSQTSNPAWLDSVPKLSSTPAGTVSVNVKCQADVVGNPTSYDQVYLNTVSCVPNCTGKCGGSDGCGGTCPNTCTAPQVCGSNNQCSCPANTCGSSCTTCAGATPYCSASGQCVQCTTAAQCPSGYLTCTNGTCGCRAPDATNKLVNPNFDAGSYAPWINTGATFSTTSDADNCPASGTMNFTPATYTNANFSQCVSMAAGTAFRFGFRYTGTPICTLWYHSAAGCSASSEIGWEDGYRAQASTPMWTDSPPKQTSTPAGTVSVNVKCVPDGLGDPAAYDQFYLNTVSCVPSCTGKCGGSDGCGGTCPNTCPAPQVCGSNNQCSCPANTCGSSCITCPASAPVCSATGQCVQCTSAAQCPSGYMTCTNGSCGCRIPSSTNKIVNPGFDAGSYAPWVSAGGSFSSTTDADNCPASGTMKFLASASTNSSISQCLSVGAGVSFRFGFRYIGAPICVLTYHSVAGCNASYEISREDGYRNDTPIPMWTDSPPKQSTTPAGTVSVKVVCVPDVIVDPTTYDQFYFNTGGGAF